MSAWMQAKQWGRGALLSYAYLFFSNKLWLGALILGVTFFDVVAGASGIVAIVVCQLAGCALSFNRSSLLDGMYSYNALMVGLAMGAYYEWSLLYFFILVLASVLSLLLTVWIGGQLAAKGLPALSIPFLITIWVLLLGLFNFSGVKLAVKSEFTLQHWFPHLFSSVSSAIDNGPAANVAHLYLRSLSATIFQYNDLAGIVIAAALLLRSRIAFALSIYGFGIGYGFYHFFEGDFTPLVYSYIGFNFILTAIALGGFFIVPSAKSHLLLFFVIPVTALLLSALHTVLRRIGLPLYSLPFNIIVLLIIGALQMRTSARGLVPVIYQQFSPELNHYKHVYYQKRFAGQFYHHLQLPVMGEWRVPQGYGGRITHRGEWQYALDFDIADDAGSTFSGPGFALKDYYCYDLPVLAPAAGVVTMIKDGVRDNVIGDMNLEENWGNTIILKHAEGLYTKLSHLRPGSFRVAEGAWVQRGELIGSSGSSGRSPEPHLHFQAQATPYIGSHTLRYPLAYFLVKTSDSYAFRSFDVPAEGDRVRNVLPTPALAAAFAFIPGEDIVWRVSKNGGPEAEVCWSAHVDALNRKYIHCHASGAVAYCYNDGVLAYFTDFYGCKDSWLYLFYIAFQKVLLGAYRGVTLQDWLLPQTFFHPTLMVAQDFLAPFVHFLEGHYSFRFAESPTAAAGADAILIETESRGTFAGRPVAQIDASMSIRAGGIDEVRLLWKGKTIIARCVH